MECSNEEIIAYLDALIKYKQSWFKPQLPIIGDTCLEKIKQKYRDQKGITAESTPIDFYKESNRDLTTLLNYFNNPEGDSTNSSSSNLIVNETNNKEIIELQNRINKIKKTLAPLVIAQNRNIEENIYNYELSQKIGNLILEHNKLLDELEKANAGKTVHLGGKRKSKRRKNKKPTKKGKKNRKSKKKSMKKTIKK